MGCAQVVECRRVIHIEGIGVASIGLLRNMPIKGIVLHVKAQTAVHIRGVDIEPVHMNIAPTLIPI